MPPLTFKLPSTVPNLLLKDVLKDDAYIYYARNLLLNHRSKRVSPIRSPPRQTPTTLDLEAAKKPVGILGAGAGGLYAALILESLGIPYHIIEARKRVGGRLFTYQFPDKTGNPYNYYDVGAMRFPKILAMKRLFHLFQYQPLNQGDIHLKSKLQPYYFTAKHKNSFLDYNGVTVRQNEEDPEDPFHPEAVLPIENKEEYIAAGTKEIVDDVIRPFATGIFNDLQNGKAGLDAPGWRYMMKYDHYSTRAYMSIRYCRSPAIDLPMGPLPTDVVNWCETFDNSTGSYDRALAETVLEAIAFGWNPDPEASPIDWVCVGGGAQQIAECMKQYILSRNPNAITDNTRKSMDVVANGVPHEFSHVISTIPLPVLRTIDLTKAGLSHLQSNALRQLDYGPSTKVGMQFKTAWWTTSKDPSVEPLNIVGGQSFTDRPLRTIVYPSFGKDIENGTTTTLIGSYCWTEDAMRMGALISKHDEADRTSRTNKTDKILEQLVLQELAVIHKVDLEFLRKQLIDFHAWSWSQDPHTMGAFALFGPGKFETLYTSLNAPAAKGHLHFASEALSVRHAWVEGALDSAWRAICELLHSPGWEEHQEDFYRLWGVNPEWVDKPMEEIVLRGGIPRENDLVLRHMALAESESV